MGEKSLGRFVTENWAKNSAADSIGDTSGSVGDDGYFLEAVSHRFRVGS
jgi:hypothetical protein